MIQVKAQKIKNMNQGQKQHLKHKQNPKSINKIANEGWCSSYERSVRINAFLQIQKELLNQLSKENLVKCGLLQEKAENCLQEIRLSTLRRSQMVHPLHMLHELNSILILINKTELEQALQSITQVISQQSQHKYNFLFISRSILFKAIIVQKLNSSSGYKQQTRRLITLALKRIKNTDLSFLDKDIFSGNDKTIKLLGQIIILHYHFAVLSLAQLNYSEGTTIYQMLAAISQKILGKYHSLSRLMKQTHRKRFNLLLGISVYQKQTSTKQYSVKQEHLKRRLNSVQTKHVNNLSLQKQQSYSKNAKNFRTKSYKGKAKNENKNQQSQQKMSPILERRKQYVRECKNFKIEQNNFIQRKKSDKKQKTEFKLSQGKQNVRRKTAQDVILQRQSQIYSKTDAKRILAKKKVYCSTLRRGIQQLNRVQWIMHDFESCKQRNQDVSTKIKSIVPQKKQQTNQTLQKKQQTNQTIQEKWFKKKSTSEGEPQHKQNKQQKLVKHKSNIENNLQKSKQKTQQMREVKNKTISESNQQLSSSSSQDRNTKNVPRQGFPQCIQF